MTNSILRNRLRRSLNLDKPRAVLGNENGVIYVDPVNRKGYVNVRKKTSAGLSTAFVVRLGRNCSMVMTPGAAVRLGWEDGEQVVEGPDVVAQIAAGADPNANNAANRPLNRFISTSDIVQFATTAKSPESLFVAVTSLFWIWGKTVNHFYASEDNGSGSSKGEVDLSSYVPAAGEHRLVGIFLKRDNTLEVSASTAQTIDIPIDVSDVQECLTGSSAFDITGDVWYLHDAQTVIAQSDFFLPLRQIIEVPEFNYSPVRVVTAAGAVTVATTDYIIVVNKSSGAATTVNLPSSPATGLTFIVKDGKGDANTNNITLTPAAGNIDGAGTHVMNVAYQSRTIVYNGTQWNVIGGYL